MEVNQSWRRSLNVIQSRKGDVKMVARRRRDFDEAFDRLDLVSTILILSTDTFRVHGRFSEAMTKGTLSLRATRPRFLVLLIDDEV